jgi:hypothetical protein
VGGYNVAMGYTALKCNVTGAYNIALGYLALQCNLGGSSNFAAGFCAMNINNTGYSNAAIGSFALTNNTSGYNNISIGASSLCTNNSGYQNVALGLQAMRYNNAGYNNVAIGAYGLLNSCGIANISIGYNAGCSITTGCYNVIIGSTSANFIATQSCNVLLADGLGTVKMSFTATGALSIGSTLTNFGSAGQALVSQGPNSSPIWSTVSGGGGSLTTSTLSLTEQTVVATTTTFSVVGGYIPGQIQVFANGILLSSSDYTASTSPTVVLNRARNIGDIMSAGADQLYHTGRIQHRQHTGNAKRYYTRIIRLHSK